ncbi:hypothetical protein GQ43DRAFT_10653, partial [Delitschia confertaspora ATCC 74209]
HDRASRRERPIASTTNCWLELYPNVTIHHPFHSKRLGNGYLCIPCVPRQFSFQFSPLRRCRQPELPSSCNYCRVERPAAFKSTRKEQKDEEFGARTMCERSSCPLVLCPIVALQFTCKKDKNATKIRLLNALNEEKLEVPASIIKLQEEWKMEWKAENRKLNKGAKSG